MEGGRREAEMGDGREEGEGERKGGRGGGRREKRWEGGEVEERKGGREEGDREEPGAKVWGWGGQQETHLPCSMPVLLTLLQSQ